MRVDCKLTEVHHPRNIPDYFLVHPVLPKVLQPIQAVRGQGGADSATQLWEVQSSYSNTENPGIPSVVPLHTALVRLYRPVSTYRRVPRNCGRHLQEAMKESGELRGELGIELRHEAILIKNAHGKVGIRPEMHPVPGQPGWFQLLFQRHGSKDCPGSPLEYRM